MGTGRVSALLTGIDILFSCVFVSSICSHRRKRRVRVIVDKPLFPLLCSTLNILVLALGTDYESHGSVQRPPSKHNLSNGDKRSYKHRDAAACGPAEC